MDSSLRPTKVLGQFSLSFALNKAKKCQLPQIHPWRNPLNLIISLKGEWFVHFRTAGAILLKIFFFDSKFRSNSF